MQQLVNIMGGQWQHEFTLCNQNFSFTRGVLRKVLVKHVVDEVSDLDVASN